VHEAPLERVHEQVPPFARLHLLDEQLVGRRDVRPFSLHGEQRLERRHLRAAHDTPSCLAEPGAQQLRELSRTWAIGCPPSEGRRLCR
jgi:hypothetical protein